MIGKIFIDGTFACTLRSEVVTLIRVGDHMTIPDERDDETVMMTVRVLQRRIDTDSLCVDIYTEPA